MTTPRFTHVWWGDGYLVYDGNEYIGKDDQIDEVRDLMVPGGITRVVDAEDQPDVTDDFFGAPLDQLLAALGAGVDPSST